MRHHSLPSGSDPRTTPCTPRPSSDRGAPGAPAAWRDLDRLETVGRYAASVAHELNNLLAAVMTQAELAAEELPLDDPAAERLERVVGQAERAAVLTRELLTLSRRPSGRVDQVDLGALVLDSAPLLERLAGPGIRLAVGARRDAGTVEADRGELYQVLLNLVSNARDAMPCGGELRISVRAIPGAVELTAQDTGCGMDDETRARAFEPFFTTKPAASGTGLGLSIVRDTVERAGGSIDVVSVQGRGTTFRVMLPARTARNGAAGSEPVVLRERSRLPGAIAILPTAARRTTIVEAPAI